MHDIPFVLQCKTCTSRFVSCCDAGQGGSRVRKRRTVRDSQRETKKNRKDTEREREREREGILIEPAFLHRQTDRSDDRASRAWR